MNYTEWLKDVPKEITDDLLWRVSVYRLALFLSDIAWLDASALITARRTIGVANQLYEAVGSISANVAEGYSRGTGRDRARFYEYALGSAREARDWYFKARHILGEPASRHRLKFLSEIIRLLLTMVPDQRAAALKEDEVPYCVGRKPSREGVEAANLDNLLDNVPPPTGVNTA